MVPAWCRPTKSPGETPREPVFQHLCRSTIHYEQSLHPQVHVFLAAGRWMRSVSLPPGQATVKRSGLHTCTLQTISWGTRRAQPWVPEAFWLFFMLQQAITLAQRNQKRLGKADDEYNDADKSNNDSSLSVGQSLLSALCMLFHLILTKTLHYRNHWNCC